MKKRMMLCLICLPALLKAQQTVKEKRAFQLTVATGIAAGESGVKQLAQLAGGFKYESQFYTGIGVGYDGYRYNSFPVFADWQMRFGKTQAAYIYAQAGYNIPGSYKKEAAFGKQADQMRGGLYADGGIGYRITMRKAGALFFSGGYSQKNMTRKEVYMYPCWNGPCDQDPMIYKYRYTLGRIMIKAGWAFNN
jgi:hypothetical protein